MRKRIPRSYWIACIVLGVLGLIIALFLQKRRGSGGLMFVSDLLFTWGMLFFFWGCICKLNNVHAFTSFSWGVKNVKRLLQNRQRKSEEEKEAYLAYRESRPYHEEAGLLLLTAAVLIAGSVLAAVSFL